VVQRISNEAYGVGGKLGRTLRLSPWRSAGMGQFKAATLALLPLPHNHPELAHLRLPIVWSLADAAIQVGLKQWARSGLQTRLTLILD